MLTKTSNPDKSASSRKTSITIAIASEKPANVTSSC